MCFSKKILLNTKDSFASILKHEVSKEHIQQSASGIVL